MVDCKSKLAKKSTSEVRMLIKQELYGVDWHRIAATEVKKQLEAFQVSRVNEQVDYGCHYDQELKRLIFNNAENH